MKLELKLDTKIFLLSSLYQTCATRFDLGKPMPKMKTKNSGILIRLLACYLAWVRVEGHRIQTSDYTCLVALIWEDDQPWELEILLLALFSVMCMQVLPSNDPWWISPFVSTNLWILLMVVGRYILTPIFMHQSIKTVNGNRQLHFKCMKSNKTRRGNSSWLESNHSTV